MFRIEGGLFRIEVGLFRIEVGLFRIESVHFGFNPKPYKNHCEAQALTLGPTPCKPSSFGIYGGLGAKASSRYPIPDTRNPKP